MRIGAGALRGRSLKVAEGVRPTSGRSKQALFSRWQATLPGCSFLDLFAGSGGIGLEAVSRGAREAVLVERSARALKALRGNCERLAPESCVIIRAELPELPGTVLRHPRFEHVFADPPYDFDSYDPLLEQIARVLAAGGEAAIEHSSRVEIIESVVGLALSGSRRYGESVLSFYARSGARPLSTGS